MLLGDGNGQPRILDPETGTIEPFPIPGITFLWGNYAPDGTALAVTTLVAEDSTEVQIRDNAGIHRVAGNCVGSDWTPQGDAFAVVCADDPQATGHVVVKVVSGNSLLRLISVPGDTVHRAIWSPNGQMLAIGANSNLLVLTKPDGSSQIRLRLGEASAFLLGGIGWRRQ